MSKDWVKKKNDAKRSRQRARIQRRSSSTEGRLSPKVFFYQMLSSIKGRLPLLMIDNKLNLEYKSYNELDILLIVRVDFYCHNPYSTSTQLKSWVWHENDFSPPSTTHTNSISAISQLLLSRFWWNFKGRFLETSRIDSNCPYPT